MIDPEKITLPISYLMVVEKRRKSPWPLVIGNLVRLIDRPGIEMGILSSMERNNMSSFTITRLTVDEL